MKKSSLNILIFSFFRTFAGKMYFSYEDMLLFKQLLQYTR